MHPTPGQPLPEGWIYIEHPEAGRSENPIREDSLSAWEAAGWAKADGPSGRQGEQQGNVSYPQDAEQQQRQQQESTQDFREE